MRKIIVSNLITLDGYFEGINNDLSWFKAEEEFFAYVHNLFNEVDTILYGRLTYDKMAAYWPSAQDNDALITEKMNSLKKIVLSKQLKEATWNNTEIFEEHITDKLKELKQQPGKNIVIFGSGTVVSELTQLRLIDEFRLIINPVILGNGTPLFKSLNEKVDLELIDTKVLSSGVVILSYKPLY